MIEAEWEELEEIANEEKEKYEVEVGEPKVTILPEGKYVGELEDIEVIQTSYGNAWRWWFRVSYKNEDGDVEEGRVSGVTSMRFVIGSKSYRWYSALMGKEPAKGEKVNLLDAVGKKAIVVVKNREGRYGGKFSNVVDVLPLPKKKKKS